MSQPQTNRSDTAIYLLGGLLGLGAGLLDVKVGDLLFTALAVLASTMLLGALRPNKPWRWMPMIATFVPIVRLLAFLFLTERPDRAQIYESLLELLPAAVGAYGGALGRGVVNNILGKKLG
jgi:hypothetical protein